MNNIEQVIDENSSTVDLSVNAVALLKSQHREVEELFAKFEDLGDRAYKERARIFNEIAARLEAHTKIEEMIFYPMGQKADKDLTLEAYVEHDSVKYLLKHLRSTDPSDEAFKSKMTVLKEQVEHHVREEENAYFPKIESKFSDKILEELAQEMLPLFEKTLTRSLAKTAKTSSSKNKARSQSRSKRLH